MATEKTVTLICDYCESEQDVHTLRVQIGNQSPKYIEACAEHRKPFDQVKAKGRAEREPLQLVV